MVSSSKNPQAVSLDAFDRAILAALVEDGRMTNSALAARVGLAESTCAYRVRALRESGVISSINARIDLAAIGRPIQAVVKVHLSSHSRVHIDELFDRLVEIPGTLSVVHVAGDNDFHLHMAVASPERLRDLILEHITSHPAVTKTETQLVFEVRRGAGALGPL
ncbi:Lrp/AsnC family transcriptional regulator [Microbacterium flavescens]|jgi:DNA-binding Lrp family transcriptional regulator|uniref:Lrp/AsnC family transcriptional regulator n=1 Tax=Microbacterium flavescens TaxID=69366 RepID=UPI001BDE706E|nr:Lrp/AsnC family transcriptional regulator [Microbacterium flavescens]BFF11097.1 Lrp/AsnC family transcriptional regulator [Microbacterium flavescens]